jgi:hypothetical protein
MYPCPNLINRTQSQPDAHALSLNPNQQVAKSYESKQVQIR